MDDSKDAEVRARVTADMFRRLMAIAASRGEQLPVILREALAEYLAKRLGPEGTGSAREAIVDALRDKPDVVQALLDLATAIKKPVTYRKGSKRDTQRKILDTVQREAAKHRSAEPRSK